MDEQLEAILASSFYFMAPKTAVILLGGSLGGIPGHIACLQALEDLNVTPDLVIGVSAGSVIGSLFALGLSPKYLLTHVLEKLTPDQYLDPVPWYKVLYQLICAGKGFQGLAYGNQLEKSMEGWLGEKNDFSQLKIPLYIIASNLTDNTLTIFHSGKVSDKVRASVAIPGVFYPKEIGGQLYVDGVIVSDHIVPSLLQLHPTLETLYINNFTSDAEGVTIDLFKEKWGFLHYFQQLAMLCVSNVETFKDSRVQTKMAIHPANKAIGIFKPPTKETLMKAYGECYIRILERFKTSN